MISLYWGARQTFYSGAQVILFPSQLIAIMGEQKGLGMLITVSTSFLSLLLFPTIGHFSDRCMPERPLCLLSASKRLPLFFAGNMLRLFPTLCFMFALSLPTPTLSFLCLWLGWTLDAIFDALATSPYMAIIPDVIPPKQLGLSSGVMGLLSMFGSALGIILTGFLPISISYFILFIFFIISTIASTLFTPHSIHYLSSSLDPSPSITVPTTPTEGNEGKESDHNSEDELVESNSDHSDKEEVIDIEEEDNDHRNVFIACLLSYVEPFRSKSFLWVFITRLLWTSGFTMVYVVILFFVNDSCSTCCMIDMLGVQYICFSDPKETTSIFSMLLMVGSIFSSFTAGYLSDKLGRKPMIYLSGVFMILANVALVIYAPFMILCIIGFFFGLGYGGYLSVDYALVSDVLPSGKDTAKDMGIWHASWSIPILISPGVSGVILYLFHALLPQFDFLLLSYRLIFLLSAVLITLGIACTHFI